MCGRYVVTNPVSKTNKLVKSAIQIEDNENYNAHPYQKLPVIKKYTNGNTLENLKWGIIPSWSKKKDFKPLINARLETIDEKITQKKPANATVVNFGVCSFHLKVTEKIENPIEEVIPNINPINEFCSLLSIAIIPNPTDAIKIDIQTLILYHIAPNFQNINLCFLI